MRIKHRQLAVMARAVARESLREPSTLVDETLAFLIAELERRQLGLAQRTVYEILETEAAPTRDAAQPSDHVREG